MEQTGVIELMIALPRETSNAPILSSIWTTIAVLQPSLISSSRSLPVFLFGKNLGFFNVRCPSVTGRINRSDYTMLSQIDQAENIQLVRALPREYRPVHTLVRGVR